MLARAGRLAAALVLSVLLVALPAGAPPAAAADPDLRLSVSATYTLDPDDHEVHVRLDVRATNLKPNRVTSTVITRYFYESLTFGVHDEARNVRATQGGRTIRTSVRDDDGFRLVTARLASRLLYQQTARLRIAYDLPGGAPRSTSAIRVGRAFSTFYAWAWGDPGRASVRIEVPSGFETAASGSDLARSTEDGATVLRAEAIADPDRWYASVDAARPGELTAERLDLGGGQRLTIRAWPEDEAWLAEVGGLMRRGLPLLRELIGLDWPVEGELSVSEVHTPLLEGYAGVYYTDRDEIEIGEDLDDLTVLHEASHAWFNGELWTGRWISEGFADTYAALAVAELGEDAAEPRPADRTGRGSLPLSVWEHPGRISDEATDATESYGYNTAWWLVDQLVDEIGVDDMREVLAAADARTIAYVGAPRPEPDGSPVTWGRLLDLLEEIGGSERAEALFREFVVTSGETARLDERAAARERYVRLRDEAGDWELPYAVRSRMAKWEFAHIATLVAEAEALLAIRDELHGDATALGLDPPDSLETAWETATTDLEAVRVLAEEQRTALEAVELAAARVAAPRDALASIGLLGAPPPEEDLTDAREAWEADRSDTALAEALAARTAIDGAPDVGRTRALAVAAVLGLVGLGVLVLVVRRRRRARRAAQGQAALAALLPVGESYATLPAQPGSLPAPDAPSDISDAPAPAPQPPGRIEPS